MVRRLPPVGTPVLPGSTPVVAFGDSARAEVATLGINPSAREFVEKGVLLEGADRRLATLDSLHAGRLDDLTAAQVASIIADCASYFQRQPYRRWFDPLDQVLHAGTGTSYYDGSACHLDLVQWATDPIWGNIRDRAVRRTLLEDGVPHLRAQLKHEHIRVVVMNGNQVLEQVVATQLAELTEVGRLPMAHTTCRLLVGKAAGITWVGWSANIQSSRGVTRQLRRGLAEWLGDAVRDASAG